MHSVQADMAERRSVAPVQPGALKVDRRPPQKKEGHVMGTVVDIAPHLPGGITADHQGVHVRVLNVGKRKMTRTFFNQIPIAKAEAWPERRLGWVETTKGPFLIYADQQGRLRRMNITGWGRTEADGTRTPATEFTPQVFIG